jgi:hypothetical protein
MHTVNAVHLSVLLLQPQRYVLTVYCPAAVLQPLMLQQQVVA